MSIDLRHLRYFVAVAEELSFSRAAERLHITQPALSESIRELEAHLGADLFVRSSRHVSLTWPGTVLLDEARRILRMVQEASALARDAAAGDKAVLRVGVVDDHQPGIVSKALARVRHLLPELRLALYDLPTALQLQAIRDGRLDVGLIIGPVAAEGVVAETLWTEPLVAALPLEHPQAKGSSLALTDLQQEAMILPDPAVSPGYHARVLDLCRVAGFTPRRTERSFHFDTMLAQVAAGIGVALVLSSLDITRRSGVVAVPLTDGDATVPVMMARRREDGAPDLAAFSAAVTSSRR